MAKAAAKQAKTSKRVRTEVKPPVPVPLVLPEFLRRLPAPSEPDLPDVVHAKPVPVTDMRMVTLHQHGTKWSGARSFLVVTEGHEVMHLLHVPTFEYIRCDIVDYRAGLKGEPRLCAPDLADRIRKRADQLDTDGDRYSRVLVSRALTQLGAEPLPDIVLPVVDGDAPDGAIDDAAMSAMLAVPKPTQLGSKTQIVHDLLVRAEGTTRKEIMQATGWPSVSVDAQAKAASLTLRKVPGVGGAPTRYFGTRNKD